MKTRPCGAPIRQGRLDKAIEFLEAAELIKEIYPGSHHDAFVTNCISAGIAAADVITCAALGEHAMGDDHTEAVRFVKTGNPEAAKQLDVLLRMKTASAYTHTHATADDVRRAERAAAKLVERARVAHSSLRG